MKSEARLNARLLPAVGLMSLDGSVSAIRALCLSGAVVALISFGCSSTEVTPTTTEEVPGPTSVSIDTERRTTAGSVATENLHSRIEELRRLLESRGTDAGLRDMLVSLLSQRVAFLGIFGDFDELDRLTAEGLVEDPESVSALLARASFYSSVHRFGEASSLLDDAEVAGAPPVRIESARLSIELASEGGSASLLARARALAGDSPSHRTLCTLAAVLASTGVFESADATYREALVVYRDVSPFPLAWVAFQRGAMWAEAADRPDLALPLYREAVRRLPGYVTATVHLAELEADLGQRETALRMLEELPNSVRDPEPAGLLSELLQEDSPDRAGLYRDRARRGYERLLGTRRAAFLDHGSEFFAGPGGDPDRGLALALENLALRRVPRAHLIVIEAAVAAEREESLCEVIRRAAPLRTTHRVLDRALAEHGAGCGTAR